jgi:hypothetical protein
LFAAQGLEVGEIETQALWTHEGPLLLHVITEYPPQGGVEQVGCGVVQRDRPTAPLVHAGIHAIAYA